MNALFASILLAVAAAKSPEIKHSGIRTMPVSPTPESSTVQLVVAIPKEGEVVGLPAWIQFRIDGFALGAAPAQFDRASELAQTDMGQTVRIVIDDHPFFAVNEPAIDPFNEEGFYYDMSFKVKIPFSLKEGMHTIRCFPARAFGESLKGDKAFVARTFYVGSAEDNSNIDLSKPYLTYNEPSNQAYLEAGKPILLDFYVSNAELSPDGYRVRLKIDGEVNRTLTSWLPFYIYGLKKGKHTIQLELIDGDNKIVSGPFSNYRQTITIH